MEWVISANPQMYDVQKAFGETSRIDWRQTATQQVDDIVYIYIGKPVQALLYMTIVEKVDIPFDEATAGTEYWLDETDLNNKRDRHFMRLRLLEAYPETSFPLEALKEYGLKAAPQGPVRIQKELLEFLSIGTIHHAEEVYREGKSVLREHFIRERNQRLVEDAKEEFLEKEGRLFCEACGFDFEKTYGDLGKHFIEAHHTIPVSEMEEDHLSKVSDIALLCSNCYRMIHRKMPWISVEELKSTLANRTVVDAEYATITRLKAYVGGFFGASYTVEVDLPTHQVYWCHWEDGEEKATFQKSIRASTAQKFVEELNGLNLLHWKKHYVDPDVCDGTFWSVEIIQDGRMLEKHGENEFPDEWSRFCKLISRISGKKFS